MGCNCKKVRPNNKKPKDTSKPQDNSKTTPKK